MEKIIFFCLVIPILAVVLYLGGTAIMNGFSAKKANQIGIVDEIVDDKACGSEIVTFNES